MEFFKQHIVMQLLPVTFVRIMLVVRPFIVRSYHIMDKNYTVPFPVTSIFNYNVQCTYAV